MESMSAHLHKDGRSNNLCKVVSLLGAIGQRHSDFLKHDCKLRTPKDPVFQYGSMRQVFRNAKKYSTDDKSQIQLPQYVPHRFEGIRFARSD
jgi:hypothetical protein